MDYQVTKALTKAGKRFEPGDTVELDADTAKFMLERGAVKKAAKRKKTDEASEGAGES